MISNRSGGIDSNFGFQIEALEEMPKHSLGRRGAANIAHAHEKDAAPHSGRKCSTLPRALMVEGLL